MAEVINAVDRALEVLIYLGRSDGDTSVTELARGMGLHKSTAFRTLATLQARGFVDQDPATERYRLGNRLFTLGKRVESDLGFCELARPFARKLCKAWRETVTVSVLERAPLELYRSVIILKEESWQAAVPSALVGAERECHCSSVGKCLLAFSPDVDLSIYGRVEMTAHTRRTITSPQALKAELDKVKLEGYAMDREELERGLVCVAAPILNGRGEAVAAISLSGPTGMMADDLDARVQSVRRTAREVGDALKEQENGGTM